MFSNQNFQMIYGTFVSSGHLEFLRHFEVIFLKIHFISFYGLHYQNLSLVNSKVNSARGDNCSLTSILSRTALQILFFFNCVFHKKNVFFFVQTYKTNKIYNLMSSIEFLN
jgi:hypothetical protein